MCIILLLTIAEEIPLWDYRISIQDFSLSLIMLYIMFTIQKYLVP